MVPGFGTVVLVSLIAAAAPIIVDLLPGRNRVPQVVLLLLAGILVGPMALGWAQPEAVDLLSDIGLGFVFLLAGYELDPALRRERAGRLAGASWLTSLALAAVVIGALTAAGLVSSFGVVTIALTTTALGTLLPILRDNDMLSGRFGRYFFAVGAIGELGPIVAMALFLGTQSSLVAAAALMLFLAAAVMIAMLPVHVEGSRVAAIILQREHTTSQTTLRIAIALLFVLLYASSELGFDNVLGAFVAGMVLRHWSPGQIELLERKLDAVGYGFFIPIFFVYSGMTLDIDAVTDDPVPLLVFFVVLLAVRGAPAFLWYRSDLPRIEQVQLAFLSATSLPMLVALTSVGVSEDTMTTDAQAACIGAGVLSVLVFPLVAVGLQRRKTERQPPVGVPRD